MKKVIVLVIILVSFTSCGTYTLLTKEKYDIVYRDGNQTKIKAKFEKPIVLEMVTPDTLISKVNDKGVCTFEKITRSVYPIPAESKVKITEETTNSFVAEFIEYKMRLPMRLNKNGEFVISCDRNNVIEGTRYIVKDSDPKLLFKNKKAKSTQNISLRK
jgi:hypothetical protein